MVQTQIEHGCRVLLLLFVAVTLAVGQSERVSLETSKSKSPLRPYLEGSGSLRRIANTMGSRIYMESTGRMTLSGVLSSSDGAKTNAVLTWQNPGSVRFERADKPSESLIFDGVASPSKAKQVTEVAEDQAAIWESLVDDSAETFLLSVVRGDALRPLGERFKVAENAKGVNPKLVGRQFDIYEKTGSLQSRPGTARVKYFYFDSVTGLLARTTYVIERAGRKTAVSTEFSDWKSANGQLTPGVIERIEDGTSVFKFAVDAVAITASVDDQTFAVK